MADRFDPAVALRDVGPTPRRGSVFDHPRIQEWLGVWLRERPRPSYLTMAKLIRDGARTLQLKIGNVTESNLYRYLSHYERDVLARTEKPRGKVRRRRRA